MRERSVLITGGCRGIGLATAKAFAEAGHRVAVTYHTSDAPAGFQGLKCHVTDEVSIAEALIAVEVAHGPVEVLSDVVDDANRSDSCP